GSSFRAPKSAFITPTSNAPKAPPPERMTAFELLSMTLVSQSERVKFGVLRAEVDAPLRNRQPSEMRPALNLVAARVQLLARHRVKRIEDHVAHRLRPNFRRKISALPRVPARRDYEHHSVRHHRRIGNVHIARHPHGLRNRLAVLDRQLER